MSELVALSFDANASPSIDFAAPHAEAQPGATASLYGWGVGWYPSSERGASVVKDPTTSADPGVNEALRDWGRFRSTVFLCHLRGHRRPRNQEDAQPFVRSYGGRQWIFVHDGDLTPDWQQRFPRRDDPAFEPLGRTDSEHAFCLLLSRLHAEGMRTLADVPPERLHAWMRELNADGQFNAMLTDGEQIAVYSDASGGYPLYSTRLVPPHVVAELASPTVRVAFDAPEDPHRTVLAFSTVPLEGGASWQALLPGSLTMARRGTTIWSSATGMETSDAGYGAPTNPVFPHPSRTETAQQFAAAQPLSPAAETAGWNGQSNTRSFSVVHETLYRYDNPVERSSHRLLLHPVEDRYQELTHYELHLNPSVPLVEYEDVFGNSALAAEIETPYSEFTITSRATVRLQATLPLEQRAASMRHAIPLTWMPWQRQMLSAYLLPPELPESQLRELSDFAMSFVARNDSDLVGTLLDLNETIYRDFVYESGSTHLETTPYEVFDQRRGVCQDFANLMICVARLLHIPARYRMGYIHTGADYQNKIQSEASHAWVEVYLPQVGWHGLDPTNGIQVGANHVRVACGRNYRDATPTSGTIYRGGGGTETLMTSVRVEEITSVS